MHQEGKFFDNLSAQQMLLNDSLNYCWSGAVVPNTIRVDHHNWPLLADAQAVRFGAKHAGRAIVRRRIEFQLLQSPLQIVPRLKAKRFVTALRHRLIRAEKYVALNLRQSERLSTGKQSLLVDRDVVCCWGGGFGHGGSIAK